MLVGVVMMFLALANEAVFGLCRNGRVVPFALRLEKQGEGVGADVKSIRYGVLDACLETKIIMSAPQYMHLD